MAAAAPPVDEARRLRSLNELGVLDSAPEREFDALVEAAALVCGVPISLISLVDADRQWFKANVGLPGVQQTPRELAFCAHAILQDDILEVPDATQDPRFADNALVTGSPDIRFYAGASLRLNDGTNAGTLCVIDREPRRLDATQRDVLRHLAAAAARALEGRRALLTERGLRETATQAAAVLRNSLDAIVTLSLDGAVTHWNAAAQRLFGYSPDEMLGQSVYKLVPAHRRHEATDLADLFKGRLLGVNFETLRLHSSGDAIPVSISLAPILTENGELVGATQIIRDIREQTRAAQALADSESRFKALSESSPLGVFATDAAGACTYTNARWQSIYGLTLAQSLGTGWTTTLHPEDRADVFAEWQRTAALGLEFDMEFRILRNDGQTRYVRSRSRSNLSAGGAVMGFVGSVEDVTERRQQQEALRSSERLLNRTGEVAGVGGWELDVANGRMTWSAQTRLLHGVPDDYAPSLSDMIGFYAAEARPAIEAAVEAASASGQGWDLELPVVRADGQPIWVRSVGAAERVDGRLVKLVGALQNVTALHRLAAELAEQHELMRVTLQSIGDAVITTDAKGLITWLNPAAERMTGWLHDEAKGRQADQVFHIVHEEMRTPSESPVAVCLQHGKVAGLAHNTVLVSRNGEEFGIEDSAAPIRNAQGEMLGVVLVFHDVTEQRRLSGEMSWRATHDTLTGLVNRAEFENRLRRVLAKAHEDHSEHALLFIDLDQFKLVNDACGHSAGDQLLQQVGKLLADTVRTRDTLARLGGDEFAVILEHCPAEQAQRVAQQICERMDDFRFLHDDRRFRIGASVGLVPVDRRWATPAAVIQAADTSCYAAKEAGRNRVHAWFDTDQAMRARQGEAKWAARLEQALDENRFQLYAQRIEALGAPAGQGLHAEVLLRMIDSDGSLVQPEAFLPAAERFHFASRIDRWVLRRTIETLGSLGTLDEVDMLCVNLSGQSIGDRAFHRQAMDTLTAASPAVCRRLCLEITETAAVTNMADASVFIGQVRALGVRIALDDFGAGASSFGYLKHLDVDLLKIDGQFIRDIIDDPLDDAAVRCFVDVARVVGVKTAAECVERAEVLDRVREIGIDFAQGFLLHRPEPIAAVLAPAARRSSLAASATCGWP
jgi:diguanylate cyclase (GGDEF)-like protein/PAS domain S-box-containing protein